MKALHLDVNRVAFSASIEGWFTNYQKTGKDHKKLLVLDYTSNMQTYFACINEL